MPITILTWEEADSENSHQPTTNGVLYCMYSDHFILLVPKAHSYGLSISLHPQPTTKKVAHGASIGIRRFLVSATSSSLVLQPFFWISS